MSVDHPAWTPARHPLARLLREVAAGNPPAADGEWVRVSAWSQNLQAIVALTGHAVLAISYDVPDTRLVDLGINGWDGAHDPRLLTALAGDAGWIDSLDVLLLALGRGNENATNPLVSRPDLSKHPRVEFARRVRQNVQVFGRREPDRTDVVTLGTGVAGLREISFEVDPRVLGHGESVDLIESALHCVPLDEVVVATVAPGNAASLRACLHAGFVPAGSVQLFSTRPERRR